MHRVELKGYVYLDIEVLNNEGFLMHRVELKVSQSCGKQIKIIVPNAPCGVERAVEMRMLSAYEQRS